MYNSDFHVQETQDPEGIPFDCLIEHLQNSPPFSQYYFMVNPLENPESTKSSSLEKNDHNKQQTELNPNVYHSKENLGSTKSSSLEKNDHNIPTDLSLNGSHPREHFESTISSSFEKNGHNIPTGSNLNGSHPTEHLESIISSSLEKNDHNIPTDLNLNGSHPTEHLENTIYFSQCKYTQGREGGKWVVNVIDSDGRVTEKHLTANDIEEDTWVTSGCKVVLEFCTHNQPEGGSGGLFGTWLGKLCLHHPFGITYRDWRKVDKQKKDDVWNNIQGKFHFDASNEKYKKSVMKSLSQKAKYHKNELWQVHQRNSLEESLEHCPSNIPKEEWQNFVHLQFNEKTKKLREGNKKSRSFYKTPHTLGKKSITRKSKEILITTGKRLSRGEMFACSRQNAIGNFVSKEAREKWVALMQKEKTIGVESIRNVPIASSNITCQNPEDNPAILRMALHQANDKIATVEESQAAYQHKMQSLFDKYVSVLDIIASSNPEIAMALKGKR